jgi:hypothetical protein
VLDAWENLAASLRQQGIEVLPAAPGGYPTGSESEWRSTLAEHLAVADVMVQLFGPHPGRRPPWNERPYAHLQAEAARAAAAGRGRTWLVWRPSEVDLSAVTQAAHRDWLTGALASSAETLLSEVLARLRPTEQAHGPATAADAPSATPSICVQADSVDRGIGQSVCDLLFDIGVDASLAPAPQPDQPPAEWRRHYEELLADSTGLLIVYGKSPPSWVQAQVQAGRKTLARMRRGLWGGLLEAPPGDQPDHGVRSHGLMLLDCRQGVDAAPLRRLVHGLQSAPA